MSWLTRFSLKNVAAVLILVLLVTFGGVYTAGQMKMEAMPDISFPVIVAITPYPGASPEDVDEKVTQPVEQALMGTEGAKKVQSISADSTSVVVVEFDFDVDLDKMQQEMKEAVNRLDLPEEAMETTFNQFGFDTFPMMIVSLYSEKKKPEELEKWVKEEVEPTLKSVAGVGRVDIKGQGPKAVVVRLKQDKLKKYNLTSQQVQQALQGNNVSIPVGDLRVDRLDMPVRIDQKITSVEDLRNMRLTVYPDPQAGMKDAFEQIGQGMEGLGQAVGGLGQAVGGLGEAVGRMGEGLGQVGQGVGLVQAQVQLLQSAQQLQAQLLGDRIALNKAEERLRENPNDGEAAREAAMLKAKIEAQEKGLKEIDSRLKSLQKQMPQPKGMDGKKAQIPSPGVQPPKGSGQGVKKPSAGEPKVKTVKLSDIAEVKESSEGNTLITRTNGKPSVNIEVVKSPDGNVVETAEGIKEKLDELKRNHPEIETTLLHDQSRAVKDSIMTMVREGLLGALFASLVILVFLRNLRTTLIAVVSIPLSVLATLTLLHQADITLNIMTLGGLAVAIGRVVDDSIVVIENIYRHFSQTRERGVALIQYATKEVGSAITSSTLTTVAVFVPLGMVSGIVGKVFVPFAVTVVIALLSSLVVAVTVVPLLAKLTLLNGKKLKTERRESRMAQIYRRALSWSLDHRKTVLLLSTLMLLASLLLIPLVGTSFLPADKDKAIQVEVKMPSGTALEVTNDKAKEIEDQLKTYSEVQVISTTVGNLRGQLAGDGSIGSTNRVNMFVSLDPDTKMDAFLKRVRSDLEGLKEDAELNVHEVNSMIPTSGEIVAVVKGDRMQDIRKVAEALTQRMEKVDDLVNVTNNLSEQKELVNIKVDQEKAAKEGLSAAQVAMSIRGLLEADTVTELENGSQVQEVKLGLERKDLASLKKLKDVRIMGATGNLVRLGDVAKVEKVKGPVTIQKENGQSYATVTGDITTSDSGAVSREVRQIIDGMDLPAGVTVSLSGETEEMDKSFAQLGVAMIVAVLAVYLVMIVAFGEATAPFTIMFSLPYAVIGGLVGLWISGQPISVSGLIGALMLIGIVVTNAIVLIDRVQQQRRRGLDVRSALLEAGGTRLRPILMTAFATIFALLPLGLGYGDGSLISQGLAVVVIGGLTSSTFLTLFIVPIMYSILTGLKERVLRKRAGSEV
mgnify:FL=1